MTWYRGPRPAGTMAGSARLRIGKRSAARRKALRNMWRNRQGRLAYRNCAYWDMSAISRSFMRYPPWHFRSEKADKEGMTHLTRLAHLLRTWKDTRGQDLIEYALMAGFVAVAAGAIMPNVASSISTIFSLVGSVMSVAANQGS